MRIYAGRTEEEQRIFNNQQMQKYLDKNRDKVNAQRRARDKNKINGTRSKWRRTKDGIISTMLQNAKNRAKRNGLKFNLTKEDITIPKICPIFKIKLEGNGKQSPNSPSIDRINSSKGYIKGNIIIVSWKANNIKGNATPDEMIKVAEFYKGL